MSRILCNAGVVLCNDGVVLCNVFLPCSTCRYSVIPLSHNSGMIGWMPHSDTLYIHPHQRLPGEEEGYVEHGAQAHVAGGDGRGTLEGEGEGVDEDE